MAGEGSVVMLFSPQILVRRPPKLVAAAPSWAGVAAGLTGHWPMNSTNNFNDVVGTNHGTAGGGTIINATGPGGANTAKQFDGASYVLLGSTPIADLTAAHSVCIWLYRQDTTAFSADAGDPRFLNFSDGTRQVALTISDPLFGGPQVSNNGSGPSGAFSTSVSSATLTMLGWSYNPSGTVTKLYFNGAPDVVFGPGSGATGATAGIFGARSTTERWIPTGDRIARIVIYDGTVLADADFATNFAAN